MAEAFVRKDWPVTVLVKAMSDQMCWQVLQRLLKHALLPLCLTRVGLSSALTSKSRRLRGAVGRCAVPGEGYLWCDVGGAGAGGKLLLDLEGPDSIYSWSSVLEPLHE